MQQSKGRYILLIFRDGRMPVFGQRVYQDQAGMELKVCSWRSGETEVQKERYFKREEYRYHIANWGLPNEFFYLRWMKLWGYRLNEQDGRTLQEWEEVWATRLPIPAGKIIWEFNSDDKETYNRKLDKHFELDRLVAARKN